MESPPKEDMDRAKVALFDYEEQTSLAAVDRSTIERAATCPWQAKAIADGRCATVGVLAEIGEAGHKSCGDVLHSWIDSRGQMSPMDLRQDLEFAVTNARPDLQPQVIAAMRGVIWSLSQLIYSIAPANVLAFDGGEDIGRSGQLAYDFPDLGVRYTSEIDLLYQGDSSEIGEEVDLKTGWKDWTTEDIAESFQFQSHAVLALEKYPKWQALRVRVLPSRGRMTYPVYFPRERLHQYIVRIRAGIDTWRTSQQENPPTWPALEKCQICPAASICPVADEPIADLASDPPGFVRKLIAVEARADAMRKLAAAHVDATKQDIQAPDGTWFGRRKPPSSRKPNATLYSIEDKSNGSDGN